MLNDPDIPLPSTVDYGLDPEDQDPMGWSSDDFQQEIIIDSHAPDHPRQAGTLGEEHHGLIQSIRTTAQSSLYYFAKTFMGGNIMRPRPHKEYCDYIQEIPPRRKLLLAPRGTLKTTISHSLIPHLLIQPDGHNAYFPLGMGSLSHTTGSSTRILLGSKGADLSSQKLQALKAHCETSPYLYAFWPEVFWQDPLKEAPTWNNERLIFKRREHFFKEATLEIIGVGGTVTGMHFNVHIHDDLIDERDRYSLTTMDRAYNWMIASRSLFDGQETALEVILGTHWANNDIYTRIEQDALDVTIRKYSSLYDQRTGEPFSDLPKDTAITDLPSHIAPLWPEFYSRSVLESLRKDMARAGKLDIFILNYFNNPLHAGVVDFNLSEFRYYLVEDDTVIFDPDPRDALLEQHYGSRSVQQTLRGQRMTPSLMKREPSLRDMYFATT